MSLERVYAEPVTPHVPRPVRGAGVVVAVQGVAAVVVAVTLVVLGVGGGDQRVAFGTAGMFVLIGVALLAAGSALWADRRWGRGVAVFAQLLLLPVAWYLTTGSHRPEFGLPLGGAAVLTLVLLFSPQALKWAAYQPDSASSDNAEPDTR